MNKKKGWIINEDGEVAGFYVDVLHRVCKDYEANDKDYVLVKYWTGDGELEGTDPIYDIVPIERVYFRNINMKDFSYE